MGPLLQAIFLCRIPVHTLEGPNVLLSSSCPRGGFCLETIVFKYPSWSLNAQRVPQQLLVNVLPLAVIIPVTGSRYLGKQPSLC